MCFLKVFSDKQSFKKFAKGTEIPVYSVYDKGEKRNKTKFYEEFRISFDVSEKSWDDFTGQVKDAVEFLEKYFDELDGFLNCYEVDACLDFPLFSRLNGEIVNQNDHLSKELIVLAGKLNLGIDISSYSRDYFEDKD